MTKKPSSSLTYESIFQTILVEERPAPRWQKFAAAMADIGCDQINYGFLDLETAARMDARCDPALSTMTPDWIAYYVDKRFDLVDHALAHVRAGNHVPMHWTDAPTSGTRSHTAFEEACEAGLKSGILVPLAGPRASKLPGAAIMIGSSVRDPEFQSMLSQRLPELISLAHLFHAGAVGELVRRHDKAASLSVRERDVLQFIARGDRVDQVAHRLALARVTVEFHLRNARKKLHSRTVSEAVARALLYGEISP
jgi:LuxR family transcriptional regulator, quorum-sensing system regulator LasR